MLNEEIDRQIVRDMAKKDESEDFAARLRKCLGEWSDRFTVLSLEKPFEYKIAYRGPSIMLETRTVEMRVSVLPYVDCGDKHAADTARSLVKEFESKLWVQHKGLFEGNTHMCRRLFHDMLWRTTTWHTNSASSLK